MRTRRGTIAISSSYACNAMHRAQALRGLYFTQGPRHVNPMLTCRDTAAASSSYSRMYAMRCTVPRPPGGRTLRRAQGVSSRSRAGRLHTRTTLGVDTMKPKGQLGLWKGVMAVTVPSKYLGGQCACMQSCWRHAWSRGAWWLYKSASGCQQVGVPPRGRRCQHCRHMHLLKTGAVSRGVCAKASVRVCISCSILRNAKDLCIPEPAWKHLHAIAETCPC
eukprot:1139125-Pelagomonas_calceolata.AAC.9